MMHGQGAATMSLAGRHKSLRLLPDDARHCASCVATQETAAGDGSDGELRVLSGVLGRLAVTGCPFGRNGPACVSIPVLTGEVMLIPDPHLLLRLQVGREQADSLSQG
jgi:hypothetical protein